MKLKVILPVFVAAFLAASCSTTLQQRRVADELYQNPEQEVQQENYMSYYEEAEEAVGNSQQPSVDSVIVQEKTGSYQNPYTNILVDDYNTAYDRRITASQSASYGMSDWYDMYFSDAYHYASAYDPSFYNVIVMGDQVWVEPRWLTSQFGMGWQYGRFYNYPYSPFSSFSPYSSSLSMTAIYGFNTLGYNGLNSYRYGYGSFGYNPYGYMPYGYSSFAYSSYYGMNSLWGNYYNSNDYQEYLDREYSLTEEGRLAKYANRPGRVRREEVGGSSNKAAAFIRTHNNRKTGEAFSRGDRSRDVDTYTEGTSRYVRERRSSTLSKPRYNRPNREANYERVRDQRSDNFSTNSSGRKNSSVYRRSGRNNNNSSVGSSGRSVRSSGSSNSSGSSRSGSSSGRSRK